MFFYSDTKEPFTGSPSKVWEMNGTKVYLSHYSNLLYLHFIAEHQGTSFAEKRQAEKEIVLCEKKLEWWKRHPNYDQDEATRGIEKLKKEWKRP